MMIKKLIAVFLLLVLSIQLLPLKQTIAWLLGGQATEELVHSDNTGKGSGSGDDLHKQFLPVSSPALVQSLSLSADGKLSLEAQGLTGRHADDVLTPPPNC